MPLLCEIGVNTQTQNVFNSVDTDSIEKSIIDFSCTKSKPWVTEKSVTFLKNIDMHDFERVLSSLNTIDVNNLSKTYADDIFTNTANLLLHSAQKTFGTFKINENHSKKPRKQRIGLIRNVL